MHRFRYIMILLFLASVLVAQTTNNIKGRITDAETGEGLPGVNITINGTVLGAASDAEGYFTVSDIPIGSYSLTISMMGYKRLVVSDIRVSIGQPTVQNFKLEPTVIEAQALEVTANKRRQSITDSPVSIGVMTARSFSRMNKIYIDDVLEYASGVNIIGGEMNIRGSSGFSYGAGSRVLLLIDGVPVMPGDSGNIKWDIVPATQIERVEIIKGAGSALYGSSAMGGVVNIITKKASDKPTTNVRLSAGSYDTPAFQEWKWSDRLRTFNDIDIDHTQKVGQRSEILVAAGRHQGMGFAQNTEYLRHNASLKFRTQLSGTQNLTFSSNWDKGEREDGLMWRSQRQALEVNPEARGDYVASEKFSSNLFHRLIVNKSLALNTRASYFHNYWKNFFHDNLNASTADRYGLEVQGDWAISTTNNLIFGIEDAWDHVSSGLVGMHDQYSIAGYLQNERTLFSTLNLTLGLRYDYYSVDNGFNDSNWSPKLGLVWHTQPFLTLRASSGSGFRAASMSERFSDSIYSGLRIIPNPNLKSERAWSHEIGINLTPSSFLYIDVSGFWSDYWDLIEPLPDANQVVQFTNLTRARIIGIESIVKFLLGKNFSADLGYTFLVPRDLELDETLAYRPQHLLTGSINYSIGTFDLGSEFRFASRYDKVLVYPADDRVDHKVVNMRLTKHFQNLDISLNANNIFNYNYTARERILEPIRHYVLTVSSKF